MVIALVPASAALAMPLKDYSQNGATGDYTPQKMYKNYSLNGATGSYTPAANVSHTTTAVVASAPSDASFAWGDAAIGAAVALLTVLLVLLTGHRIRRRRIPAPVPARPSAA